MPTYATTHFFHLMVRIKDYSICILWTKLHFLFLRPMYPDCEFNLGNLYLKTRKFEDAEKRFRAGAKLGHQLSFVNLIISQDLD